MNGLLLFYLKNQYFNWSILLVRPLRENEFNFLVSSAKIWNKNPPNLKLIWLLIFTTIVPFHQYWIFVYSLNQLVNIDMFEKFYSWFTGFIIFKFHLKIINIFFILFIRSDIKVENVQFMGLFFSNHYPCLVHFVSFFILNLIKKGFLSRKQAESLLKQSNSPGFQFRSHFFFIFVFRNFCNEIEWITTWNGFSNS